MRQHPAKPGPGPIRRSARNASARGRFRKLAFWLIASAIGSACASSGERSAGRQSNLITAEEIATLTVNNAYDAVLFLRPRWLQSRTPRSERLSTDIIVAQGSTFLGTVEMLRQIPIASVRGLRYLDSSQANSFIGGLGSRHVEGAIVIDFGAR
jgi:hypothetical protein